MIFIAKFPANWKTYITYYFEILTELQFSKVKYNRLHHATELYKIRAHMRKSGLMLHAPCTPEIRPEVRPGHRHGARAPSLTGLCINFG